MQHQYVKADIKGQAASVIRSILDATDQISVFLRHSPIVVLENSNQFGDTQLHQDVHCDAIIEKHLRLNPQVKAFSSEERPSYITIGQGDGFVVTFDPLDGSSIIDTNFSIGSIFSIWRTGPNNLLGSKVRDQVNAVITVYGSRTTAVYFNEASSKVQQLTLIHKDWIVSNDNIHFKQEATLFCPGNLRAANQKQKYNTHIQSWIKRDFTLRYTGGLVPDIYMIMRQGQGIFCNVASPKHKAKLRSFYEAACIGFLIDKAGGKSVTTGNISLMDYQINTYDDRISFAVGSHSQVDSIAQLF